jgi:uncharacterized secreted repeat protein (TIGR03808 family)
MAFDRRILMSAGLGAGLAGVAGAALADTTPRPSRVPRGQGGAAAETFGVRPDTGRDETAALQAALDAAARARQPLVLAPGRYEVGAVRIPAGTRLAGAGPATVIAYTGAGTFLSAESADGIAVESLTLDGAARPLADGTAGLLTLRRCRDIRIADVTAIAGAGHGLALEACSGRIEGSTIRLMAEAGIFALDSAGLDIRDNRVADCANNGILVWRTKAGVDGTTVTGNRIERIGATGGGSGQNGNGINVFRAGEVLVAQNRITDCAYSAIRANAASNVQMIANSCARLGEVALCAEFAFEGAVISGNLVDTAAAGISVTNFNEGGRLAVVSNNLIRNLFRREQEPADKRGEGISVEADSLVTGNTIEGAPTAGIVLGTGAYLRDVSATGNLVRNARVGILVSGEAGSGRALVANNLISCARDGAIRLARGGLAAGGDLVGSAGSGSVTLSGNVAA